MGFEQTLALDLGICDEHFSPFFLTIYSLKVAALVVLIEMIQCHVRMEAQALVAHSSPSQIYSTNMVTSPARATYRIEREQRPGSFEAVSCHLELSQCVNCGADVNTNQFLPSHMAGVVYCASRL